MAGLVLLFEFGLEVMETCRFGENSEELSLKSLVPNPLGGGNREAETAAGQGFRLLSEKSW